MSLYNGIITAIASAFKITFPTPPNSLVDPVSLQLLGNLKIMTTAVIYRILLRPTPFTPPQWLAFALLTVSGMACTWDTLRPEAPLSAGPREAFVTPAGLALVLAYCVMGGFSGVYSEKILKDHRDVDLFEQGAALLLLSHACNAVQGSFCTSSASSLTVYSSSSRFLHCRCRLRMHTLPFSMATHRPRGSQC